MNTSLIISVIIPAYNAEKYIERCLKSVLHQTFEDDYEIIVVDDGSTDSTAHIIDYYSQKYSNVIAIHQNNSGVSSARNTGIKASRGEWITFVDADDWVDTEMLRGLYLPTVNSKFDLVMAKMKHCDEKNGQVREVEFQEPLKECAENPGCYDAQKKIVIGYALHKGVAYSNLSKLYRKSLIVEYNIFFNSNISYCEDVVFNCEYMKYANILIVDYYYYYYAESVDNSLTKRYSENVVNATYLSHSCLTKLFRAKKIDEDKWNSLLDIQLINSLWDITFRLLSGKFSNIDKKKAKAEALSIIKDDKFGLLMKKYKKRSEICNDSQTAKIARFLYHPGLEIGTIQFLALWIKFRDIIRNTNRS